MIAIPGDLEKQHVALLRAKAIPISEHGFYRKWLRYYPDFCHKYSLSKTSSESLARFILKLRDRQQTEAQQTQAGSAVSIYHELNRQNESMLQEGPQPISHAGEKEARSSEPSHRKDTPPREQTTASMTESVRTASSSSDPVDSRTETVQTTPVPSAASSRWNAVYAALSAEIKSRHYSRNTLATYTLWTRKFQGFTLLFRKCSAIRMSGRRRSAPLEKTDAFRL